MSFVFALSFESVPKAGTPKFGGFKISTLEGDKNEALAFLLGGGNVSRSSFYSSGSSKTTPN
jgi:hypothetical protein